MNVPNNQITMYLALRMVKPEGQLVIKDVPYYHVQRTQTHWLAAFKESPTSKILLCFATQMRITAFKSACYRCLS